jgi:hypothetical protein
VLSLARSDRFAATERARPAVAASGPVPLRALPAPVPTL